MISLHRITLYPVKSLDESRRRFRANLEIGGCDAFWEDTLASPSPAEPREFSVGGVSFRGTNVCRRFVVPSRDSQTGDVTTAFREAFEARRRRGLRPEVDVRGWRGVYRLAVNTTLSGDGGTIAVGQAIRTARDTRQRWP